MAPTQAERARHAERVRQLIADERAKRGNRCQWPGCNWSATLHWHHRNANEKAFNIKAGAGSLRRSLGAVRAELAKCDLLCPNHHSIADAAVVGLPPGRGG